MSVLLRVLPLVAAVAGLLLPAGAQVPVKGGEVSDFDFAVDVVDARLCGLSGQDGEPRGGVRGAERAAAERDRFGARHV